MQSGIFNTSYRGDMRLRQTGPQKFRLVLVLAFAVVFPFIADRYWLNLANQIALFSIAAVGLNILVGFTGQISIGQAAFVGLGAYTAALLTSRLNVPFPLTIPVACAVTAAVGVLFGLPSARLKGLYLAIATLAAQEIIIWFLKHIDLFISGVGESITIRPAQLFGVIDLGSNSDFSFYFVNVLALIGVVIFATNLFRTRLGRALIAIRDQDIAAEVIGVDTVRYKLVAFAIAACIAGIAGALQAHYRSVVNWERYTLDASIAILSMLIIGGLGSVSGSIYGAIFVVLLPAVFSNIGLSLQGALPEINRIIPYMQTGAFGLAIILFLIFEPEGINKLWKNVKDYFRLWPFSY